MGEPDKSARDAFTEKMMERVLGSAKPHGDGKVELEFSQEMVREVLDEMMDEGYEIP